MRRGSWHALYGKAVQYCKVCECGCCVTVSSNGEMLSVARDDLESILTVELALVFKPTIEELAVAIEKIHKDCGYGAAAYAIHDALHRSWKVRKVTVKFVLHEVLRNHYPGNPEDVWSSSAADDATTLTDFIRKTHEVC